MTMGNESKSHREVADLLSWYLNKTLAAEESERVETHLAGCADCRRELEALKALEAAVVASNEQLPRPSSNMAARVIEAVDAYELQRARQKYKGSWSLWSWLAQPRFALAELLVILLLAGATAVFVARANRFQSLANQERLRADAAAKQLAEQNERYRTLAESCPDAQKNLAKVNVIFQPQASDEEIREMLMSLKANIVQGPSALGVYVVGVSVSEGLDRRGAQDEAVRRLRSKPQVVQFAEGRLE